MSGSSSEWVMKMFIGEYRHNIDAKGRLTLPSKFREKYETNVIVTKGFDGCLNIFTIPEWDNYYQKLAQLPTNKKQVRSFIRVIASKATECEIDKMGRINIPLSLRQEANLEREVVVIGNINHVEVWDEATWDDYYAEQSKHLEETSEELEFEL